MTSLVIIHILAISTILQYVNTQCANKVQIGCQSGRCFHVVKDASMGALQQGACSSCSYAAPEISSQSQQNIITNGLRGKGLSGSVWIGGRKNTLTQCGFVAGNSVPIACKEFENRLGQFSPAFAKTLLSELDHGNYDALAVCRTAGCTLANIAGCLSIITTASRSWYTARNGCLASGGELMYLEPNEESELFKLYIAFTGLPGFDLNAKYWTGLRKYRWIWGGGTDVKYTNWKNNQPGSSTYLAMDVNDGRWEAKGQAEENFVLCMSGGGSNPTPQPTAAPNTPQPPPRPTPRPTPQPPLITQTPFPPPVVTAPPRPSGPIDTSRAREYRDSGDDRPWGEANSVCFEKNLKPGIVRYSTDQDVLNGMIGSSGDFWLSGKVTSTSGCSFTEGVTTVSCDIVRNMGQDFVERFYDQSHHGQQQALPLCRTRECARSNFKNCLTYGDITSSWYDARNQCLKRGADLFFLASEDVSNLQFVKQRLLDIGPDFLNKQFWIGLRQHIWAWREENYSQTEMKFTNWEGGQPVVDATRFPCVAMDMRTGKWRTESCQKFSSVLCAVLTSYTSSEQSVIYSNFIIIAGVALTFLAKHF